jgi:hypothetical protein
MANGLNRDAIAVRPFDAALMLMYQSLAIPA